MKTIPDNNNLLDLVQKARKGTLVLPQFQRNFVWSRDDITGLLSSIMEGHFIGTFLLLRTDVDNIPFGMRSIEGADLAASQLHPDWMVLDGQQRLTSLHYVFSAPDIPLRWAKYPYRFALDLNKIENGDLESAILSDRAERMRDLDERQTQFERLLLPFTEMERWDDWLNAYERWLVDRDKDAYFSRYFDGQKPAWTRIVGRIRSFDVPTIEIPKVSPDDPERLTEVCAIFEKMNSTGVRLSVYDLLTARMYRYRTDDGQPIDMHSLWQDSVQEYTLLAKFSNEQPDVYGVYLLRTVALLRGIEVKSKSLVNLKPEHFVEDWRTAAMYMEKALQRLTSTNDDGFGVFDPKWFPYSTMVAPLAALIHTIETRNLGHHAYETLKRWYWSSVFLERYAGAVESTILRDYQEMRATLLSGGTLPQALQEADERIVSNPAYTLRDTSRVNATYRGVMCLIAIRGAKDFLANDAIEFHELDDHHVFPRAYLAKSPDGLKYERNEINCILNRTLIASSTNRRISRSKPSDYLQRLIPDGERERILGTHFIDAVAMQAMGANDYDAFLAAREKAVLTEIRRRLS